MMGGAHSSPTGTRLRPLSDGPLLTEAIQAVARQDGPAILESAAVGGPHGRFSILACDPVEWLVAPAGNRCEVAACMEALASRYPLIPLAPDCPIAFVGGWIGYSSYEAGLGLEGIEPSLPPGTRLPWVRFGLYDTAAVFDHVHGRWWLTALEWPAQGGRVRPSSEDRLDRLEDLMRRGVGPAPLCASTRAEPPQADWSWPEYAAKVAAAKEYIAAGDVYQVNLTQRFRARTGATPLELYLALRRSNPADYAAFLAWDGCDGPVVGRRSSFVAQASRLHCAGETPAPQAAGHGYVEHDCAVISASPELFLDLRGGRVVTRPIKGTRPRTGDVVLDPIRRDQLAASLKDEAELNMIIDLERNDLGKVCEIGSVRVESAGQIEAHPTVFHRVATVSGRLRSDRGPVELLRAMFPGGSVTGAPKIRALRIIDELETVQRGVYCGAIGYLGLDGNMAFNLAIRTMTLERGTVHIHAGGAITSDSDAEEEYQETLAKAEGMFRALRAVSTLGASPAISNAAVRGNAE